jgi:hypothetical protein
MDAIAASNSSISSWRSISSALNWCASWTQTSIKLARQCLVVRRQQYASPAPAQRHSLALGPRWVGLRCPLVRTQSDRGKGSLYADSVGTGAGGSVGHLDQHLHSILPDQLPGWSRNQLSPPYLLTPDSTEAQCVARKELHDLRTTLMVSTTLTACARSWAHLKATYTLLNQWLPAAIVAHFSGPVSHHKKTAFPGNFFML